MAKRAILLTCMDPRLDPLTWPQLGDYQLYTLRNAGGRATEDVVRSLIFASQLFAINQIFIVHHTDCGLEKMTDHQVQSMLGPMASRHKIDFLSFRPATALADDKPTAATQFSLTPIIEVSQALVNSVVVDINKLQQHPLVPKKLQYQGFVYDLTSNRLWRIP